MSDHDSRAALIVLDDDPTGTQAVTGVPVLLEWSRDLVAETAARHSTTHLLTNSRSFPPAEAERVVRSAAAAAVSALRRPRIVLRGDSTLRAHLLEEYRAVCDARFPGRTPPLLLVPALPAAGRVTVGGVHLIERDGRREPLHETEYALDPSFAYADARLLQWASDRSNGIFPVGAGREVGLEALRGSGGAALVATVLSELSRAGAPAVCVPDAETVDDLRIVAEGLRLAEQAGAEVVARCAPAFVGALAGNLATELVSPPVAGGAGALVVVGSYVAQTTRQLAVLCAAHPGCLVEVDVRAFLSERAPAEIARAAGEAAALLAHRRLAIVATPRQRPDGTTSLEAGRRIAESLARVAADPRLAPGVIIAKGGITAHVTAHVGLGSRTAFVIGPIASGVALWRIEREHGTIAYVVFPGNVGDEGALAHVVDLVLAA